MHTFTIQLTDAEYTRLNSLFAGKGKSSHVGARAMEILRMHFLRLDPATTFRTEVGDADLEITNSTGEVLRIEVKGTADPGIAWGKLKVSGTPSHTALVAGMPVYRVCGVEGKQVQVFVMKFPEDFTLTPEPRWRMSPNAA
jgi:hypothetical protein